MIVIFVSQCEKNALKRTRRVLDAFANRIGDNCWQTIITEEGLSTVKKMLRQTASKSTSVSCHWIRSRSRSDLLWVVGNKKQFNEMGYVAVNSTEQDLLKSNIENNWYYLPIIRSITKISALLHDWGKSTVRFQKKLNDAINPSSAIKPLGDPIRHEFISSLLFTSFIHLTLKQGGENNDKIWLDSLCIDNIPEIELQRNLKKFYLSNNKPFINLPNVASLIVWLLLSHHKLPILNHLDKHSTPAAGQNNSIQDLLSKIDVSWGYENVFRDGSKIGLAEKWFDECFEFQSKNGLLTESRIWLQELKSAAEIINQQLPLLRQSFQDGSWRVIAHHARLCLMLGDHYYSSKERDSNWQNQISLIANTGKNDSVIFKKQQLDEHLYYVAKHAVEAVERLPEIHTDLNYAYDLDNLSFSDKVHKKFIWQDNVVKNILLWRKNNLNIAESTIQTGVFIINMASTGCGKTLANAKIMQALSSDEQSLRFILALGLRTLTLQTGDEYRKRAGLGDDQMAVLVGSKAIKELHEQKNISEQSTNEKNNIEAWTDEVIESSSYGSNSAETLLDEQEELDWKGFLPDEILSTVIPQLRDRQILYAPVLVCTIDHIIGATETKRGGRYILPSLRLFSSDLVIDEVDDFSEADLIAIGRLIYLAGMLGRKVMLSSATIPPDLALGFFNAYQKGWKLYAISHRQSIDIACMWFDEFTQHKKSFIQLIETGDSAPKKYESFHEVFINNRVKLLTQQAVKQRGNIIKCELNHGSEQTKENYFSIIKNAILSYHNLNNLIDLETNIRVSFGVIRMANITPCIELTKYLMNANYPQEYEVRVMAYHSQQVLLIRHEQEKLLDSILNRKDDRTPLQNPLIRKHLSHLKHQSERVKHLIFILVATPVEEVGRDHDFDWAIVEPSSMRSIIQLAGRVSRHRDHSVENFNVGILQYNLKGFMTKKETIRPDKPVFQYPGYEKSNAYLLNTHNMCELVDEEAQLSNGITAIPRIKKNNSLKPNDKLVDLEHYSIRNTLDIPLVLNETKNDESNINPRMRAIQKTRTYNLSDPKQLNGFIDDYWWMTAQPQVHNHFRASKPSMKLFYVEVNDELAFYDFDFKRGLSKRESILGIKHIYLNNIEKERLWLNRDYSELLSNLVRKQQEININFNIHLASKRFGEITFTDWGNLNTEYFYNDNLGMYSMQKS